MHTQLYLVSVLDKVTREREEVSVRAWDADDARTGVYEIRDMKNREIVGVRLMTRRDLEALDL